MDCWLKLKIECYKLTDDLIKDKQLRESFKNYIRFIDKIVRKKSVYARYRFSYILLINYFKDIKYEQLGWKFLCDSMHYNYKSEINNLYNINIVYKKNPTSMAKAFLEDYFIYLLQYEHDKTTELIKLKKYEYLVRKGFSNKPIKLHFSDFFKNHITTQYPLNSDVEAIYQGSYLTKKVAYVNVNLNTTQSYLKEVLKEFIEYENFQDKCIAYQAPHLIFIYFFENSFGDCKVPIYFTEFNVGTFNQQYNYYKSNEGALLSELKNPTYNLRRILIHFYIFLQKYINELNEDYNIFENSWINTNLLPTSNFTKHYELGYKYVIYSPLESYPEYDLWWLSNENFIDKSTSSAKNTAALLDFTKIKSYNIKNDVKDYIWNGPGNLKTRSSLWSQLISFLNFREEYNEINKDVLHLNNKNNEWITFELLWQYRLNLECAYSNNETIKQHLKAAKGFLIFTSKKYKIDRKNLNVLNRVYKESEGNPITKKDFFILEGKFRELSDNFKIKNGKLFYYIFILISTTDLRLGEALSLERDCITFKNKNGDGTIRFKRKTSKGQYILKEYSKETIRLIELSQNFTEKISSQAQETLKKYIFLTRYRDKVSLLAAQFSNIFTKIVNEVGNKLEKKYVAYNLRHTFINIIYDEVTKGSLTISKAQQITGNKYETVMKHYRRKLELKDYVEVMCGLLIADVDINGKILKDNDKLDKKYPVMRNLGCCSEKDCINETTKCLACQHFITTLSKIPIFEQRIKECKSKLEECHSNLLQQEIKMELRLLGVYLTNMLKIQHETNYKG